MTDQSGQPQGQQEQQWLPPGPPPLVFDTFEGMDTKPTRPGVDDKQAYWLDGFIPLGKNNLRTCWGIGPRLYTVEAGTTITCFNFFNIGPAPYCVVFRADGAVDVVQTSTRVETNLLPPGTIQHPTPDNVGITQWGNLYLIIVANQDNGYWLWDGNAIYTAGTISPLVTLTNPGEKYTSPPTITLSGGSGGGATFTSELTAGSVTKITPTNPGSGYQVGDQNVIATVTGGGSDNTATATATISATGGIQRIVVTNGGGGYTAQTVLVLTGGGGSGVSAAIQASNGTVTGFNLINQGIGYTSAPAVSLTDHGTPPGAGFAGYAELALNGIQSIAVTNGGSGYTTTPTVTIVGDGTGASATAEIAGGVVTAINIVNAGQGYTQASVLISGGNNAASASVELMPFGVKGTDAETYDSRVWVANGSKGAFTGAESISDFSTSGGGGLFQSTDSFLRNEFVKFMQTNGFLYLLADSSINYISGVTANTDQATGTVSTTFTNQNADPEIGTPWSNTVDVLSRNIVFANTFGAHVAYGGAASKVSDPLDGVYWTVPFFGNFIPSACKAIHFGRRIWCLLLPIVDPMDGAVVNKLLCWDGKQWFATGQDMILNFVQHQEIDSIITAYGTDGTYIYPLFYQPSNGFKKTVQSKFWDRGSYAITKTQTRVLGSVSYFDPRAPDLTVSIDTENGSNRIDYPNANPKFSNTGPTTVLPVQACGNQGVYEGFTLTTFAADMALISLTLIDEIWQSRI